MELKGSQELEIIAETESRIEAAMQILFSNMTKRGLGLKCLDVQKVEPTGHQMYKLKIILNSGINKEKAKIINKAIKDSKVKVSSQYLDEKIRVSGKKIDDLQFVIDQLKKTNFDVHLDFVNFKK